jgi:hypothetical protein
MILSDFQKVEKVPKIDQKVLQIFRKVFTTFATFEKRYCRHKCLFGTIFIHG